MAHPRPEDLLSKRDEKRLIKAGQRVLLEGGYPNPERVGCPGDNVLKAIALRDMPLKDSLDYIDHMGYCSPCFVEYTAFRRQAHRRKVFEYSFASAALVLLIVAGVWLWKAHRFPGFGRKPSVVAVIRVHRDLKNWTVFRGEQPPGPHSGPVPLPRGHLEFTISLSSRWKPGNYQVAIATETGKVLVEAKGSAVTQKDGSTLLTVVLDDSRLKPGSYVLEIEEIGGRSRSFPAEIK